MYRASGPLERDIEASLLALLPRGGRPGTRQLDDALHYAVFPGGKRLRPILTMLGASIFGPNLSRALPASSAVEFIHTSSLIFDDLPCMDNAELRRGGPVVHRVYGEEFAVLAGLALLNQAYGIFAQTADLVREAVDCIGVQGMIGGQVVDISLHQSRAEGLAERDRKTSSMMRLSLTAGALACGASPREIGPLATAGELIGDAYQIYDDLLDARSTSACTGKTANQDQRHGRPSHDKLDDEPCSRRITGLVGLMRETLETAYGPARVADLISFVDSILMSMFEDVVRA